MSGLQGPVTTKGQRGSAVGNRQADVRTGREANAGTGPGLSPRAGCRPARGLVAVAAVAVTSLVLAACGGGGASATKGATTKRATTTTAAATGAARRGAARPSAAGPGGTSPGAPGRAFGPAASGTIASISGSTLEVQDPQAQIQTTVEITPKTVITQTLPSTLHAVAAGVCISAVGTKAAGGAVAASSVTIFGPSSGGCSLRGAFGRGGPPGGFTRGAAAARSGAGRPRTTFTRPANFASATGKVMSVAGTKITVLAERVSFSASTTSTTTATETVEVGPSTRYSRFEAASVGSLKVGECAVALGTTNDIGAVTARSLSVSQPTSQGCTQGPAGGFFFGRSFGQGAGGGTAGPGGAGAGANGAPSVTAGGGA